MNVCGFLPQRGSNSRWLVASIKLSEAAMCPPILLIVYASILQQAVELDPSNAQAQVALGAALALSGDPDGGIPSAIPVSPSGSFVPRS